MKPLVIDAREGATAKAATASAPMEPMGWPSKIGAQVRPASVVFHTPPLFTPM